MLEQVIEKPKDDFNQTNFDLLSSNSSEPSNTIKINPIVPKIGNVEVKSGISISNNNVVSLTNHPKTSNSMTDGFACVI
jgi:hypothetical protein